MACQRQRPRQAPTAPLLLALSGDVCARLAPLLRLRELRALCAACQQCRSGCCQEAVWELCFRRQWPKVQSLPAGIASWKQGFLHGVHRGQQRFRTKTFPNLVRRARCKDGSPDLRKLYEALRPEYFLQISTRGSRHGSTRLRLSRNSIEIFSSSVGVQCSFPSLKVTVPFSCAIVVRASALGTEAVLAAGDVSSLRALGSPLASNKECKFVKSFDGRLLYALWNEDSSLCGLLGSLHHADTLRLLFEGEPEAVRGLFGKPEFDDIDRQVGLHDYTVHITLRGSKIECFQQRFYKVDAMKGQEFKTLPEGKVAQFEVLPPHGSGEQLAHPCTRSIVSVFQTGAFRCTIPGLLFLDVTVYDEHGHIMWTLSTAQVVSEETPGCALHADGPLDFDAESDGQELWAHASESGKAQVAVQFFCASSNGDGILPRINTVVWSPVLSFLNSWFGSSYV